MIWSTPFRNVLVQHSPSIHRQFRRCWSASVDGRKSKKSYFHQTCSDPLRQITIGQLMTEAAGKWPSRQAVVSMHENAAITFLQAETMATRLASGLLEVGLEPGDRLALLAPNTIYWYISMIAAAKAGLIAVNVNPALVERELKYCLNKVGVGGVVCNYHLYHTLTNVAPEILKTSSSSSHITSHSLPQLRHIIVDTKDDLPGARRFDDVLALTTDSAKIEDLDQTIQPDDPASIQFSSGTTGQPKAALLTHFTTVNNSYFFGKRLALHKKEHRICLQVPLFHTFGSTLGILGSLNHGATLVLPSPKYSPKSSVEAIKKERCTVLYGTPTMYTDLCSKVGGLIEDDEQLKDSIEGIEAIVCGGATCTAALFNRIVQTFKCSNIVSVYGMTESSPLVMQTLAEDPVAKRFNSAGSVSDHVEIKVVDTEGRMVPMGSAGEVWYRSYATMLGYWDDQQKTNQVITPCRWMKSGDLFILHEDGYGEVVGRLKDVIIRGGENIYPAEVEHVLETHPHVLEAQVYGISDARMGEEVCTSLKMKRGSKLTREDVHAYCTGKMAGYKIPKYVEFVENFPKTESGKVKKFLLQETMERNKDQCLVRAYKINRS